MASFTDKISQFNPYIQELPVEAMVQVGMAKQAQYEQGVQKIQNYVDRIAGLDVTDKHKPYLQSKLNELGSKLKTVAAGDFSNQQLVNSVSGMVGQVSKDSIIQNGVYSAQLIKKGYGDIENAKKTGKYSESNGDDYATSVNDWMNNPDLKSPFRGSYTPYKDVSKKVLDVIGKLHPKASSQDIAYAYKTNKDGTVNITGILDAMERRGIKTVDEGQIRTALSSVLDASDYNQLAIDGRYNLKGVDEIQLSKMATREYDKTRNFYKSQLDAQKAKLLLTTDPNQQQTINDNISFYEEQLGDPSRNIKGLLDESYNKTLESIATNPRDARGRIYTKNYLDGIANGFAWAEVSSEIVSNPVKENFWKKKNYELDQLKEVHLQQYRKDELGLRERKQTLDELEFQQKYGPTVPYFKTSGDPTTNELTALQNYSDYNNKLQDSNTGILMDLAAKTSSITTRVSPENIKATITKYKNGNYTPATQYEKQQMDKYIANENLLANQEAIYKQYENEARNEVTGGLGMDRIINSAISKKGNLIVGNQTFTPREIYNYLSKEGEERVIQEKGSYQVKTVPENLTNKEKLLAKAFEYRYTPAMPGIAKKVNEKIVSYLSDFSPVVAQTNQVNQQVLKKVANKMAPITGVFQTQQAAITFKNNDSEKQFISDLTNIAKADLDQKTGDVGYKPSKAIELLTKANAGDLEMQFKRSGDNYTIQLTNKNDPKDSQVIKVDADFVSKNSHLGSSYLTPNTDLSETLLRNAGTTNMFKDKDHAIYQTGRFGGYDSKGNRTVTIPIAADLENQGGQLYPVFRVVDNKGKTINFPFPQPTDRVDFESKYLPSLTDEKIIMLLKTKYPNIEQLIR